MTNTSQIINNHLCISCGLCTIKNTADMVMKKGTYIPQFRKQLTFEEDKFLYEICPGKGYNITSLGKFLYGKDSYYDYRIGHYQKVGASYSLDSQLLEKSTSGGMIPTLALYLLKKKMVDGILTVKFIYTADGPKPKPFIAKTKEDLILSQGSKYMPIPLLEIIDETLKFQGKLAVIGTPCQIAGLRLLQKNNKKLRNIIKYTIANFCGGYRDYRETERLFEILQVDKKKINFFSYRGNGQPGTMSIHQDNDVPITIKYPDYAKLTGFTKYYRCRLCIDATGELADISFGDAWLKGFIDSETKWSFYICRSKKVVKLLEELKNLEIAKFQDISIEDLIEAQKGNITTKKERQKSRLKLYKLLRKSVPSFDGGFNLEESNIFFEIKVFISQKIMYILEVLGLYLLIAKIIKRVK